MRPTAVSRPKTRYIRHWVTIAGGGLYELDELRDYLGDLRKYATAEPEAAGIGRNVEAFDAVRLLSYRTNPAILAPGRVRGVGRVLARRGSRLYGRTARPGSA